MVVEPFQAEGEVGEHEIMMHIEILLRFVINVDFELRDFVFRLRGDEQIVGRQNFELFAVVVIILVLARSVRAYQDVGSTHIFQGDIRIFVVVFVVC